MLDCRFQMPTRLVCVLAALGVGVVGGSEAVAGMQASAPVRTRVFRVAHVADGDTIDLANGARVRMVQIDTPEVYFQPECYGRQASAVTRRLLAVGALVRLLPERATDRVDQYGRLLRYVIRMRDGLNVNVRLVAVGAAAPYFYAHRRGRYAARLEALARRARVRGLGLWGRCPGTPYDPYHAVDTGPVR